MALWCSPKLQYTGYIVGERSKRKRSRKGEHRLLIYISFHVWDSFLDHPHLEHYVGSLIDLLLLGQALGFLMSKPKPFLLLPSLYQLHHQHLSESIYFHFSLRRGAKLIEAAGCVPCGGSETYPYLWLCRPPFEKRCNYPLHGFPAFIVKNLLHCTKVAAISFPVALLWHGPGASSWASMKKETGKKWKKN